MVSSNGSSEASRAIDFRDGDKAGESRGVGMENRRMEGIVGDGEGIQERGEREARVESISISRRRLLIERLISVGLSVDLSA